MNQKSDDKIKQFFNQNTPEVPKAPDNEFQMIMEKVESAPLSIFDQLKDFFFRLKNDFTITKKFIAASSLVTASLLIVFFSETSRKENYTNISHEQLVSLVSFDDSSMERSIGQEWL